MKRFASNSTRHSLLVSIHLTENGLHHKLRIIRAQPQSIAQFLKENDLEDRIELSAAAVSDIHIPLANKVA